MNVYECADAEVAIALLVLCARRELAITTYEYLIIAPSDADADADVPNAVHCISDSYEYREEGGAAGEALRNFSTRGALGALFLLPALIQRSGDFIRVEFHPVKFRMLTQTRTLTASRRAFVFLSCDWLL